MPDGTMRGISPRWLFLLGGALMLTALVLTLIRCFSAYGVLHARRLTLHTGGTSVYVLPADRLEVIYLPADQVSVGSTSTECDISHGGTGYLPPLENAGPGPAAAEHGTALARLARFRTGEAGHYTITCTVTPGRPDATMLLAPDPEPAMADLRFAALLAILIGPTGLAIVVITHLRRRRSAVGVASPQPPSGAADPWASPP